MPVGYNSTNEGDVEGGDVVFFMRVAVLWQKALAACSTLLKVAWFSKLILSEMMNFLPSYSMAVDCSMRSGCPRSLETKASEVQMVWHYPILF